MIKLKIAFPIREREAEANWKAVRLRWHQHDITFILLILSEFLPLLSSFDPSLSFPLQLQDWSTIIITAPRGKLINLIRAPGSITPSFFFCSFIYLERWKLEVVWICARRHQEKNISELQNEENWPHVTWSWSDCKSLDALGQNFCLCKQLRKRKMK